MTTYRLSLLFAWCAGDGFVFCFAVIAVISFVVNVDLLCGNTYPMFAGIRFEFRLQQPSGLLLFAASENQQEYIAVLFNNGRPRFMYDTQGKSVYIHIEIIFPSYSFREFKQFGK